MMKTGNTHTHTHTHTQYTQYTHIVVHPAAATTTSIEQRG